MHRYIKWRKNSITLWNRVTLRLQRKNLITRFLYMRIGVGKREWNYPDPGSLWIKRWTPSGWKNLSCWAPRSPRCRSGASRPTKSLPLPARRWLLSDSFRLLWRWHLLSASRCSSNPLPCSSENYGKGIFLLPCPLFQGTAYPLAAEASTRIFHEQWVHVGKVI